MKRGVLSTLATALAIVLAPAAAQAAAPANDAFAAAQPLSAGQEISATNLEATSQAGEPDLLGDAGAGACEPEPIDSNPLCSSSVWYVFKAPASAEYTIETCDKGTDLDTLLGVYTGATIGALVVVGTSDDACYGGINSSGSRVSFMATVGTEYRVDVTGYLAEQGSFYVRAYAGPPQPRPEPDTSVNRLNSYASAAVNEIVSITRGAMSGPRRTGSFELRSTAPGASFECSLDEAAFSACSSLLSYDLEPGSSHVFRARSIVAGTADPTPVVQRLTIDDSPPETEILSGTSGPIASQSGEWTSSSSEWNPSPTPFACEADDWVALPCAPLLGIAELCKGAHSFRTAAVDLAGNVDPTPASAAFEVTTGPACGPPQIGAPAIGSISNHTAEVKFEYDSKYAPGRTQIEYGTTTAYGQIGHAQTAGPVGPGGSDYFFLRNLEPDTEYHYRVTITTPFGTANTGDQTLTTMPLGGSTRPVVQNLTPEVIGSHAASIPFTIDPQGQTTLYRMLIEEGGPVTGETRAELENEGEVLPGPPQERSLSIVDLAAETTYHYRILASQTGAGGTAVQGPEGTFTTPSEVFPDKKPVVSTKNDPPPKRFKLRKGQVKVGKLTRVTAKLRLQVRGLPAKTRVTVKLRAGKSKQTARKKAGANGRARFKIPLAKRIRKAMLGPKLKRMTIKVTAEPPGEGRSSVTLRKALKG